MLSIGVADVFACLMYLKIISLKFRVLVDFFIAANLFKSWGSNMTT